MRDLEVQFNAKKQSLYHIRMAEIKRSTLSEANQKRASEVFRDIAEGMIKAQGQEIKDVVSLIDSSNIRVAGRGSEWTKPTETRCGKGLKLHIQFANKTESIEFASITGTNVNDITEAQKFELENGKIYVFDKGYLDFNWWNKIAMTNAYFVTRTKKNTAYKVIEEKSTADCSDLIIKDCIIELRNKNPRGGAKNLLAGKALRLVEVYDKEHDKKYEFISNLLDATADEIADYYKQRWRIELLFKWLKQNLKVTKFLSENENAIKIQIYVAIIAYVLIGMLKRLSGDRFKRSIDLMSWIRIAIFSSHTTLRPPIDRKSSINPNQLTMNIL